MSFFASASSFLIALAFSFTTLVPAAQALDLDWHGQFRAETNWLWGYSHGSYGAGASATTDQGYTIPNNGDSPASFQNLFLRLQPRVIVNDNITVHTDIWLGTPDRGMFGGNAATNSSYATSGNGSAGANTGNFQDTRTGSASIVANEFYADVATDFGTITVGRAPLNWGLGLVWNNNKEKFDRLPSTGDAIRLVTKLGAFRFMPAVVKYRLGSNYGGSAGATPTAGNYSNTRPGGSGANDYVVGLSYTNDDEQIDLGLQFMRRIAGSNADIVNPYSVGPTATTPGLSGYAYNIWDFYAKKQAGIFTFSAEVPLVTGLVANHEYNTVAAAGKIVAKVNDHWSLNMNVGKADGQANVAAGTNAGKFTAFYFHPDYRPGLLMFNYQYRNLSNGSLSPYDNPVTNAQFISLGATHTMGKFTHEFLWLYAVSDKAADGVAGNQYFNQWDRIHKTEAAGVKAQEKGLGFEVDYALGYDWDESFRLGVDVGLLFPGKFYKFANGAVDNPSKTVFGSNVNLIVKF